MARSNSRTSSIVMSSKGKQGRASSYLGELQMNLPMHSFLKKLRGPCNEGDI